MSQITDDCSYKITVTTHKERTLHETLDDLKLRWKNLFIAKENLRRIEEHYEWLRHTVKPRCTTKRPVWLSELEADQSCDIVLKTDTREDCRFSVPWCNDDTILLRAEIKVCLKTSGLILEWDVD